MSAELPGFGMKRFSKETLTHLPVLNKQHADGVLAAEVKYVNVVLNSHLRERLNPRRGGGERKTTEGEKNKSSMNDSNILHTDFRLFWYLATFLYLRLHKVKDKTKIFNSKLYLATSGQFGFQLHYYYFYYLLPKTFTEQDFRRLKSSQNCFPFKNEPDLDQEQFHLQG